MPRSQAMSFQVISGAKRVGITVLPPTALPAPGGRKDSKFTKRGTPWRRIT